MTPHAELVRFPIWEAKAVPHLDSGGTGSQPMKKRHDSDPPAGSAGTPPGPAPRRKPGHGWRKLGITLLVIVVLLAIGRALLPWAVRDYVNRTLDTNTLYSGKIGPVHVQLLRGAYSIDDVRLSKTTGNIPVPFFSAKRVNFAIQWGALVHRKVVGRIFMEQPSLNFVDAPSADQSQTGAGGDWLQMIRGLFPFDINRAVVHDGTVHFRTYQSQKPVDVYLSHLNASIDDLSNIKDETKPLVATVQASAMAMDQARLDFKMTLDPFAYHPTFHMALRLLGLDVTKLNDFALTYGDFDFKRGFFDLVVQAQANEGQLQGYVKPLFRNLRVFSLKRDIKEDTVLQFFWQALIGAATTVFKNFPRDQFGTLIPFTGDLSGTTTANILATIGNVLRNAFVRAYLPRLQNGRQEVDGLQFQPPDVSAPVSSGESS